VLSGNALAIWQRTCGALAIWVFIDIYFDSHHPIILISTKRYEQKQENPLAVQLTRRTASRLSRVRA
jgi:hypothetical protein